MDVNLVSEAAQLMCSTDGHIWPQSFETMNSDDAALREYYTRHAAISLTIILGLLEERSRR